MRRLKFKCEHGANKFTCRDCHCPRPMDSVLRHPETGVPFTFADLLEGWKRHLQRPCPACGAAVGESCKVIDTGLYYSPVKGDRATAATFGWVPDEQLPKTSASTHGYVHAGRRVPGDRCPDFSEMTGHDWIQPGGRTLA